MATDICSCDKQKPFEECCEPYLKGAAVPATAADLMRSRYTAFARHEVDYLMRTLSPARRKETDPKGVEEWSKNSEWLSLQILATEKGGPEDETGQVEFVAKYREAGVEKQHDEIATFVKLKGAWHFDDGRTPPVKTVKLEGPKIGRNDPCPCGSGKKYKKCHG
jgi:SEC-C motif-containing protein